MLEAADLITEMAAKIAEELCEMEREQFPAHSFAENEMDCQRQQTPNLTRIRAPSSQAAQIRARIARSQANRSIHRKALSACNSESVKGNGN